MAQLVSSQEISKTFGTHNLFRGISLGFSEGERLGLIGPNGSGKSTLLKIFAGLEEPDAGTIFVKKHTRLVFLPQEDALGDEQTVEEVLLAALAHTRLPESDRYLQLQKMASQCGFTDRGQTVGALSGGWRKRLAIAAALIQDPELLLLDEPTNHLDLDGILWLEQFLKNAPFAFVLISHDRYFLEAVTNRIIELSKVYPDGYLRIEGSYQLFLRKREEFIEGQMQQQEVLANKVRREEEWLSRGPKARTTKAQYRIDDAHRLQGELAAVRKRNSSEGNVRIDFHGTQRKTKKLLTAKGIGKVVGGRSLFANVDLVLSPGKRIGLLGLNGTGKSTLMHILLGDLAPDTGTVERADGLKMVMFDQKREQLNQQETLRKALSPVGDTVVYQEQAVHVVTWAKRFLFTPEQLDMPVNRLSGGEQARILIARLMLQPADILLLDEPTNDLDIPSLEILEESLLDFPGALVLVSHDRSLLDRVTESALGLDGQGGCELYSGHQQWLRALTPQKETKAKAVKKEEPKAAAVKVRKLTFTEAHELKGIEAEVQKAEEALALCQQRMTEPEVVSDPGMIRQCCVEIERNQAVVDKLYRRWEELEALK